MQPGKSESVGVTDGLQPPNPDGQGAAGGEQTGERLYAGQFKSVEELEAAYAANADPKTPEVPKTPEAPKGGPGVISDEDETANALKAAGLDQDEFTQEFATNGALSEESFAKLEKHGFPRAMVQVYVQGLQAQQAAYNTAVYTPAGGEAQYAELLAWAKTGLNAEQKRAFNESVTSGDPVRASLAVQGVVALRGGGKPQMLNGKPASGEVGPQPFKSHAQVVDAMRDPRYRRDPAYRKEIADRLRVSEVFR